MWERTIQAAAFSAATKSEADWWSRGKLYKKEILSRATFCAMVILPE